MANFNNFGDYMFSLLFTPLRKVKKSANQFYIFFKVAGKVFDDCKSDIFTVRKESMIISASEIMLPEHGKDRNMTRLKNEDVETYRTRLSMKAIISQKAGTMQGVLLSVKSLGYLNSEIISYSKIDPTRWAEFLVKIVIPIDQENVDYNNLRREVRLVKEASAKDNYQFTLTNEFYEIGDEATMLSVTNQINMNFWSDKQLLDGSLSLNGNTNLNHELVNYTLTINDNQV